VGGGPEEKEEVEEEGQEGAATRSSPLAGQQQRQAQQARLLAVAHHNVAVELEQLGRRLEAVAAMGSALQLAVAACGRRDPMARQFSEQLVSLRKRCAGGAGAAGQLGGGAGSAGAPDGGSGARRRREGALATAGAGPACPAGGTLPRGGVDGRARGAARLLPKARRQGRVSPAAPGCSGVAAAVYPDGLFAASPALLSGQANQEGEGALLQAQALGLSEAQLLGLLQQEMAALGFSRATELSELERAVLQRSLALEAARRV
jgi:hypothetical protein